jgi:hypothetical protein
MPEHYPTNPNSQTACQECCGSWQNDLTCRNCFQQLLYWENENPALGSVHHLMVLSYHLQHPSLYSPEGLQYSLQQLIEFLEAGISPKQALKKNRTTLDSGIRQWTFKPKPGSVGGYIYPTAWHMTIQDVVNAGTKYYVGNIQRWAHSILADLRSAGNL